MRQSLSGESHSRHPDGAGSAAPGSPTAVPSGPQESSAPVPSRTTRDDAVVPAPDDAVVPAPDDAVVPAPDDAVVHARDLVKTFGHLRALDGLDLTVRRGEVHGFLGPNGAGKSTAIRAVLGQLRLDSGHLAVLGRDPWREAVAVHEDLAYVPAGAILWPTLTGGECIDLLGSLQGRMNPARRARLVDHFELDTGKRARSYSTGNRQKVVLVAALACDVDLYVLDEPTGGLDPLMEEVFRACVTELRADGRTVLLSSHLLDEVEALCDRVTIIRRGAAVSTGSLADLRAGTSTTVEATFDGAAPDLAGLGAEHLALTPRDGGTHLSARVHREHLAGLVAAVAAADPVGLTVRPPDLDELFLEHYAEGGPTP